MALTETLREVSHAVGVLRRAGILQFNPMSTLGSIQGMRRYGPSLAGGFAGSAAGHADRIAIIDEIGSLSWKELGARSNAISHGLRASGIGEGDGVALMCRNHRGFVEGTNALCKIGANVLYLNTAFAGPQLREVVAREKPKAIIYDDEFKDLLGVDGCGVKHRFVAWHDGDVDDPTLDSLIESHSSAEPDAPKSIGKTVILTSGTTGTPKGAPRPQQSPPRAAIAMLDRIPYRSGEVMMMAAPMFHSWGFANMTIGLMLGATYVLQRRFDPEATLAAIEKHRASCLVAVPVMLQRILELPKDAQQRHNASTVRIVPLSGSAIPAGMAERWMDAFGDNIYNLYGSTEVGWVSIATPEDLRAAPGTAGRPPLGADVRLFDGEGKEAKAGQTGRIFVKSELNFEGYTGGGHKEIIDGFMSTGDTGHFDANGRLFVEGRDDEMIVSGGENVFPREVEDLLSAHPDIVEVAIIGVDDEEFGKRLKAFVVKRAESDLDENAIRTHVKSNLARYKVPRDIVFIDELPRNPTGKILKRQLT